MKSDELLGRLVEVRTQEWVHDRREGAPPTSVVTVTREPGCGGESITEMLAAELKLHLYSWGIVEQIAKDTHFSARVVSALDEKIQSELEDWLRSFQGDRALSSYAYIETLKKVLFTIAAHGNAIILGRGGNFLIPLEKRIGLSFVAPLEARIRNVVSELQCSEECAREHIAKLETEQQEFVKTYFNADIHDPTRYHLVVNTAVVAPGSIVRIVKAMIEDKTQ